MQLFVSVGTGLRKVAELEEMARTRSGMWVGWAVSVLTVLLASCVALPLLFGGDAFGLAAMVAFYTGIFFLALLGNLISGAKQDQPRLEAELAIADDDAPQWLDFYGSADPVPNGPIFEHPPGWLESQEVWTTASLLSDRRRYWRNPDGFVLPVARLLAGLAQAPGLGLDAERIRAAARRRAWRVGWLVAARGCIVALALVAGVTLWSDLVRAGDWISKHAPEWAKSAVTTVFKPFRGLLDALGLGARELLAAGLIAVTAGTLFASMKLAWNAWNRNEETLVFRREPFGLGGAAARACPRRDPRGCVVLAHAALAGSWDAYTDWLGDDARSYYVPAFAAGLMTYGAVVTLDLVIRTPAHLRRLVDRVRDAPSLRPGRRRCRARSPRVGSASSRSPPYC